MLWRCLDIVPGSDSLVRDANQRLQQRSPFNQRKAGHITILPTQQIEDVVVNSRCFGAEMLQEIEIGAAALIDGDQFSIYDRSRRQLGQRFYNIRELSIQRFSSPRE